MKKNGESAALTSISSKSSTPSPSIPITPSYYDEAYAVGSQDLSMVTLDTACTSHMFGTRKLLNNIHTTAPSSIQVASKNGNILASERGTAHLD